MILIDLLKSDLKIVFCGTAAGTKSAKLKAYYAGPGNLFYTTLAKCGLTPYILKPEEFPSLLSFNIGLTDLVKQHFGSDKDLKEEHYDTKGFEAKIIKFQPQLVCFNGKEAARVYFNLKNTRQVSYGLQNQTIGNTKLFVAPSTSAQARAYWDENVWQQLTNLIN